MSKFRIYPYKVASASVKKLKTELGALIIKTDNSRYVNRDDHTVINWGNSERIINLDGIDMLNSPEAVALASNKLECLQTLSDAGVSVVSFTTSEDEVREWLDDGLKVYVRHKLNGHSGDGIEVIFNPNTSRIHEANDIASRLSEIGYENIASRLMEQIEDTDALEVPAAPLYTMGVPNLGEYRVHVFHGRVILYQKKSRRVDDGGEVIDANEDELDVRNLSSGWIYRTGNLKKLERVEQLAIEAVAALGLDFGAVDIIKDSSGDVLVLEVNTAPGLGNQDTLDAYTVAFNTLIEGS